MKCWLLFLLLLLFVILSSDCDETNRDEEVFGYFIIDESLRDEVNVAVCKRGYIVDDILRISSQRDCNGDFLSFNSSEVNVLERKDDATQSESNQAINDRIFEWNNKDIEVSKKTASFAGNKSIRETDVDQSFGEALQRIYGLFVEYEDDDAQFATWTVLDANRKQHAFTKEEEKKDENDGKTVAHGSYDQLLNLVYSTCMEFMKSYNAFPWKSKHNERLTELNQMYNELRVAEDRFRTYYRDYVHDVPNGIEIEMSRDRRKIVKSIQRYTDGQRHSGYISEENEDAYLRDGELHHLDRRMKEIHRRERIKRSRKRQYESIVDDHECPKDIVIDEEIIERTRQTTTGDADDEYDGDEDIGASDDEIIVEVDYYDTDSVISEENLKRKLEISGSYVQTSERLYKLTEEDIMYTDTINKQWKTFIRKYNDNIAKLEAADEALKQKEEKTEGDDDIEDESKESDVLNQKIKRKYSMASFPLLHQLANLRLRLERIIENELHTVHNLDRFVHVMMNRIFNKCNDLSIDNLIEFAFKRFGRLIVDLMTERVTGFDDGDKSVENCISGVLTMCLIGRVHRYHEKRATETGHNNQKRATLNACNELQILTDNNNTILVWCRDCAPQLIAYEKSYYEDISRYEEALHGNVIYNCYNYDFLELLYEISRWSSNINYNYLKNDVNIFKIGSALRSIAENLFDEDDNYRILCVDNKKVQQRILLVSLMIFVVVFIACIDIPNNNIGKQIMEYEQIYRNLRSESYAITNDDGLEYYKTDSNDETDHETADDDKTDYYDKMNDHYFAGSMSGFSEFRFKSSDSNMDSVRNDINEGQTMLCYLILSCIKSVTNILDIVSHKNDRNDIDSNDDDDEDDGLSGNDLNGNGNNNDLNSTSDFSKLNKNDSWTEMLCDELKALVKISYLISMDAFSIVGNMKYLVLFSNILKFMVEEEDVILTESIGEEEIAFQGNMDRKKKEDEDGYDHIYDIIDYVFQYLLMLKQTLLAIINNDHDITHSWTIWNQIQFTNIGSKCNNDDEFKMTDIKNKELKFYCEGGYDVMQSLSIVRKTIRKQIRMIIHYILSI